MRRRLKRITIVNAFGALGYMCILIAWTMVMAVVFLMMVDGNLIVTPTVAGRAAVSLPTSTVLSAAEWLLTALMVIATFAILITLPYFIGKGGSHLLRKGLLLLHIPRTKSHMLLAKAAVAVLPSVCFALLTTIGFQGPVVAPLYITVFLTGIVSLVFFTIQYLLAVRFNVQAAKIW